MPKRVTSYSPRSKFAPDGYRRISANLKSASLNVTLGADVLSAAGLREGDCVSLLLNGREAAIVRGGNRKLKRCYSQLKVDFAKVLLADQNIRFQPTIEGGVIYFDIPESVEINQELVR